MPAHGRPQGPPLLGFLKVFPVNEGNVACFEGLLEFGACDRPEVALAGGYARHLNDTVRIHANTIRVAREFGKG